MTQPLNLSKPLAPPKLSTMPVSPNQAQFISGLAQTTKLNPTVLAAWLRNEEPETNQNTDPAGHGRFNFLNVGITDSQPYGAASTYWNTTPQAAGAATGNWLLGRLAIPGFGKSAASIQTLGSVAGETPAQQIAAIQHSGWASGGETALPGLYSQFSGQRLPAATVSPTPTRVAPVAPTAAVASQPTVAAPNPFLQSSLDSAQAATQRAFDALGHISGHALTAAPALDLSSLTQSSTPSLTPEHSGVTVPLRGPDAAKPLKGLDPQAQKAIAIAKQYLNVPYLFGGSDPTKGGVDCSGLLQYVWGKNGVKLPRTAAEQAQAGTPVPLNKLQPADGLYFKTEGDAAGITHAAMYIGNGLILEAPHTGESVKIAPLAGYYQQHLVVARRFA